MTALEVKEDGQIWLIPDCPEEPTIIEIVGLPRGPSRFKQRLAYETALTSAERLLVSNQDVAKTILLNKYHFEVDLDPIEFIEGIYPIPDLKWERKKACNCGEHLCAHFSEVAVISLPEQKIPIHTMDGNLFIKTDDLLAQQKVQEVITKVMKEEKKKRKFCTEPDGCQFANCDCKEEDEKNPFNGSAELNTVSGAIREISNDAKVMNSVPLSEDKTAHGIALKFTEIFQDNYPKKPAWQMMDDLRKDIERYAEFKSKDYIPEPDMNKSLELFQKFLDECPKEEMDRILAELDAQYPKSDI